MIRGRRRPDAYYDGVMSAKSRRRFERELERSPGLAAEVERREELGRLLREAWTDGPASPSPEYLIAAVRPELARVDRERGAEPVWLRAWQGLRHFVPPVPASALAGAALVLLVVLARPDPPAVPLPIDAAPIAGVSSPIRAFEAGGPLAEPAENPAFAFGMPTAVYDVAQGESPLMLFEAADGTVVFWLIDEDQEVSSLRRGSLGRA